MAKVMSSSSIVRVEGIQSMVPTNPTDPRQTRRITIVSPPNADAAVMQRRCHVVLCYRKASSDESGWVVAGRLKESLGRAMQDHPLLAGRMRRSGEALEIVSNDSGSRLVEATAAEMELGDFLELKDKRELESALVFWEDVVHHNPQFSPLFYVQVTNFTCGGYSIGISCSLLLADPFLLTNIIKTWANLHNNMVSGDEIPKIPTFYFPNHGKPPSSPSLLMGPNTTKDVADSVIFKLPTTKTLNYKNLGAFCVEEAERCAGRKMASNVSLFVKESEDDRIEVCSRHEMLECSKPESSVVSGMRSARTWDELELESVCFGEGNKPIYASCWVNSVVDEGCVMIVPSSSSTDLGVKVVITFT